MTSSLRASCITLPALVRRLHLSGSESVIYKAADIWMSFDVEKSDVTGDQHLTSSWDGNMSFDVR